MVSINDFKVYTENIIANKNQSGNTLTIPEFNILAHRAQMMVFEKDRLIFLKTQESSDFLDCFLKSTTINPNGLTGFSPYPTDFQHTAAVRSYYVRPAGNSVEVKVEEVKNTDWGEIYSSQLQQPTKRFPKYSEFNDKYRFLPKNIGIVMLDYYKLPVAPIWGYTIVNNEPVYSANASTDFEWQNYSMERVANCFIEIFAQNLKDGELANFADNHGKEINSIL